MWLYLGVQLVLVLTVSAIPSRDDARSTTEAHLHDDGNGLADCGEDINPSLCNSVTIPEDCEKNSTVKEICNFSCSQSGQLWWAASKGNMTKVNSAIAAGGNPLCPMTFHHHSSDFENMTALHLAALGNHPEVVESLLDAGLDINLQTTDGATPTYYASWNGSYDALTVLIQHNANINIANSNGMTPLMASTQRNLYRRFVSHYNIAKALIDANASLDVTGGEDNATALFHAASHNPDIALLLIENNADVNIPATDGQTTLMEAADWGHFSLAKALIDANASLDVKGGWQNATALYYATSADLRLESPNIALLLIEHNADVNIASSDGRTPLMEAAGNGMRSVVEALVNANASINATSASGSTALTSAFYHALRESNPEIALFLIEHNADVNIADSNGETPLMDAAQNGHLSFAKAFIDANASIEAIGGRDTATALYYAAESNSLDIALLLLEHNADINTAASNGMTPLMKAAESGHLSLVQALINFNASLDVTRGRENTTALHYAVIRNYPDIALLLIKHNADVNIVDSLGMTPLMHAAESGLQGGYLRVVKALIKANANLDVTSKWFNTTALHSAANYDTQDIALLLLQSGADTMIQNRKGQTPADLARASGNYQLADLIESYTTVTTTIGEDIAYS